MEHVTIYRLPGLNVVELPPALEIPADVTYLNLVPDRDRTGFHAYLGNLAGQHALDDARRAFFCDPIHMAVMRDFRVEEFPHPDEGHRVDHVPVHRHYGHRWIEVPRDAKIDGPMVYIVASRHGAPMFRAYADDEPGVKALRMDFRALLRAEGR